MIRRAFMALLGGFVIAGRTAAASLARGVQPPVTPKRPERIVQLGRVRIDDYAWLKPSNWKRVWRDPAALDPAIRAYLAEEERYAEAVLAPLEPLRRKLAAEMAARAPTGFDPIVARAGGWTFLMRQPAGAPHPRYFRRREGGGEESLVLDVAERAAGASFLSVTNVTASPDGALFAWAEDRTGAEKRTIFVKRLADGAILRGPSDAYGDFAFSTDGRWLVWTWRDPASRPSRVYRTPVAGGADTLIYQEDDPAFLLHLAPSASGRFIFLRAFNDVTSEVRLIDARDVTSPARMVEPRREGVIYSVEDWREGLVVLTNADDALDFKLMLAPEAAPGRANWRDWIPETRGRTLTDMRAFARFLVRVERVEGNPTLLIRSGEAAPDVAVRFDEAAYSLKLSPSRFEDARLEVVFESPRTPPRPVSVDLVDGRVTPRIGAGGESAYEVLRLHAPTSDGERVPITLLRRKERSGVPGPLLITGYGAYGISYETGFSVPAITLVDQGWSWAVAHVRGGSEKGRGWFEAARRLGKRLSFTDFIACTEQLVKMGYAAPGRIVSFGYSAGGLLVGAALNLRPDLFAGVVGEAPFVDVLNTMSDADHPLVPLTRPVWGDPLADPADYDNLAGYSPYENVRASPYPPVLTATAIADDRVGFWEPAKWIARLRALSTSRAPMLLHVADAGGHGAGEAEGGSFADAARLYAFAMTVGGEAQPSVTSPGTRNRLPDPESRSVSLTTGGLFR